MLVVALLVDACYSYYNYVCAKCVLWLCCCSLRFKVLFVLLDIVFLSFEYCSHGLNWLCVRDLRCVCCLFVVWFGFVLLMFIFKFRGYVVFVCVVLLVDVCLLSYLKYGFVCVVCV